jgi:hypothetical protein
VFRELPDGLAYLRWPRLYEFSIAADGARVACRAVEGCDASVFRHFLFGQVLAVALARQGIEPLHASVVRVGDGAIGFLGDCTFGKSTLLASFVQSGHRVVTDDMLILERRDGEMHAVPGPGRIKLLPDSAGRFLGATASGTLLNPMTTKRSFPLDESQRQRTSLPLRMLFLLPDPDERDVTTSIDVRRATQTGMVRELLKNTFTAYLLDRDRLARQFEHATDVASSVEGFRLRYPAGLDRVAEVRDAIARHARKGLARRLHDGDNHE